jgi:predicted permease
MERFVQDLKYAVRVLLAQRAFTLAAVAALALGIGATTAVFSVVDAVLLKPLPYPDPDRIVVFMNTSPQGSGPGASPAKFMFWASQTDVIQDPAAFRNVTVNFTGGDVPEQLTSGNVTGKFFRLWGATTTLGRTFSSEEDRPGGPKVAVLSYGWWTRRFGADPSILGKSILLSGQPYTIIGVVENGFDASEFMQNPDVWTAFQIDPNTADQAHYFRSAARLKPGVTLGAAQAKLKQSAAAFREKYPNELDPKEGFSVEQVQTLLVRNARTLLGVFLAAVIGVLLIACANVANLLLVRSTVRRREMAIRAALGADRGRIVRQLITESVLLSFVGGALGVVLGLVGIRALLSINTAGLPRLGQNGGGLHVDWRLFAFAVGISLVTGILFGLMPAIHTIRQNLSGTLRDGAGASGGSSGVLRSGLVVVEIALALMLVIGSALLIRTSMALQKVQPGFDATNVLTMSMSFTGPRFATAASVEQVIEDGTRRLEAIPGVELATASCCIPLEGGFGLPFRIIGRPLQNGPFHGGGSWQTVSPNYFEVFKIRVVQGRTFSTLDQAGTTPVVVINESFAKRFFKGTSPIGQRLAIGRGSGLPEFATEPDREIVGVVADSRDEGLNQEPDAKMFVPQAQIPDAVNALNTRITPLSWMIRTKVPPMQVSQAIESALREATGLPVADVRSMGDIVDRSTSRERFNSLLMTTFAIAALVLAVIGIYGVVAYSVQQRTREIGVRLALGAEPGRVRTMVVFQGMRLALLGGIVGVAAAYVLSRYMKTLLYGVEARDPLVFLGVPVLLLAIALFAVFIPATRASRIDPLGALRAA